MWFACWLSGKILSLTESWASFDPSFQHPTCLATLKSCDTTEQSVCEWQYIYICVCVCVCTRVSLSLSLYIYIYIYIYITLLYSCMPFICFRFCLLGLKLESVWHCLQKKQYHAPLLIQKLGNSMLYRFLFMWETLIRRLQSSLEFYSHWWN